MNACSICHSWSFTLVWISATSNPPGDWPHWIQPGYFTCFQRPPRSRRKVVCGPRRCRSVFFSMVFRFDLIPALGTTCKIFTSGPSFSSSRKPKPRSLPWPTDHVQGDIRLHLLSVGQADPEQSKRFHHPGGRPRPASAGSKRVVASDLRMLNLHVSHHRSPIRSYLAQSAPKHQLLNRHRVPVALSGHSSQSG